MFISKTLKNGTFSLIATFLHHAAVLLLLLPSSCLADDILIPANDWGDFFTYYQRFLHERLPRVVRETGDKAADDAAKLENHRELAALTARLSDACNGFAHSGMFPPVADTDIKKEDKNKIAGTWNFYRNVPPNDADLWQEACYLRFVSLSHEAEVDFDQLEQIREYAEQVAEYETLQKLHVRMKRYWYAKTLERLEKVSDSGLQASDDNSEALAKAIRDFRPFLLQHLTVEHIDLAERFVMVSALCPSDEISGLLHSLFDEIQRIGGHGVTALPAANVSDQAIVAGNVSDRLKNAELVERIELVRGLLRRVELMGKFMPVWGIDLAGNDFDAKTLEGKVVLLDFWATWCAPCVAEFPHLKSLYEKYHDRGFTIVGYNVDSDLEQLSAFLQRRLLPWPVLVREKSLEGESPLSTYYGARKLPVVLLRDRDGKVVMLDARGVALEEVLEKLFE